MKLSWFTIFLIFLFLPLSSQAITLELNYPEVPTPTGTLDLNCLEIGSCGISVALLIVFFYAASVWVAGILAFLALLYAGFIYILGGASPRKRNIAKQRFVNVLWGLVILLFANTIIYAINPNIINNLENLELLSISVTGEGYTTKSFFGGDLDFSAGDGGGSEWGDGGTFTPGGNAGCASDYAISSTVSCTYNGVPYSLPHHTSAPITNDDPACNKTIAKNMLAAFGWDNTTQWNCLDQLWQGESGWNADAHNSSSCAYGVPQSLPPDKLGASGSDWKVNPNTQIDWGLNYIKGRTDYADPCEAYSKWLSRDPHWY